MERGQGSHRLRAAVERSRALRVEAAALQARAARRRRHNLIAEIERRIDALYEQLRVFEATFETWDGASPPAAALSAQIDQVDAGLASVERQLCKLRAGAQSPL